MRFNHPKLTMKTTILAVCVLLLGASWAVAQQQVNLTAGPTSINLPDGSSVPMWGYTCGTAVASSTATCAKLNPTAAGWSPVVITVPTGESLQINLTNRLTFATAGAPTNLPTSLTIVGQLGGGLGTGATSTASPEHTTQTLTWPASSSSPADGANTPPPQGPRVQSFATEVAAGATTSLTWQTPQPGTYLLESGTHPSIQGPMGLYGMVVVTKAPAGATPGVAYPGPSVLTTVTYNADVQMLFSEIDPVQNGSVDTAVRTDGFSETKVWSGQPDGCGNPSSGAGVYNTCYPPAVNYKPLYYLINGVAFDRTHASTSLFPSAPATGLTVGTGHVLVRLVNAGLRMHIPSIVGAQTGTAASGFGLIAEDGNPLPGVTRVQNEVFMAPGKTYDVMINVPAAGPALPIFDRQLSLSGNATTRDAGMLAYIGINGAQAPNASGLTAAVAHADVYNAIVSGKTLVVSDPGKGVIANDVNVYGVKVVGTAPAGLTLNLDGTFTYTAGTPTSFTYCGNGATTGAACASVTLGVAVIESASAITCSVPTPTYTSNVATTLSIKPPGVLAFCKDAAGYPLKIASATPTGFTLLIGPDGGFTANAAPGTYNFTFTPQNSQGTNGNPATATLVFPSPSNLRVSVVDGVDHSTAISDYRWIIEEDRTFFVDPNCQTNPLPAGCPAATSQGAPANFGTNFHTSYMPIVAQGCVGTVSCEDGQKFLNNGAHVGAVCDIGNGICHAGATKTPVDPSQVVLDPTKHYYISILPGDAMDPGHAMGGAQIAPGQSSVTVLVEPQQQTPAKLSVFVFEDDHPLNGEHDASGGVDVLAPNEPGLGGFNITIFDLVGGTGDSAGQLTYDEFGQPLSNALAGTKDPVTKFDACPITANPNTGFDNLQSPTGITGVIPVCPKYEAGNDAAGNPILSPLAGQALVVNLPPGRYGIVATPAADRISRGEEWLQTNTLDGGKDLESFLRINEPSYFQEFGPAGYHVSIGFANPKWINDIGTALCGGTGAPTCSQTVTGMVTGVHMSRPSDERLYGTGTRDTFGYTQCFASLGSPDGADIAFAKCADDGTFTLPSIPAGDWRLTIFDQWNDQIVDGISTAVRVGSGSNATLCHGPNTSGSICDMGEIAVHAWKNNLYTRTFFDVNGNGVADHDLTGVPCIGPNTPTGCNANYGNDIEQGLALVPTNIRFRDGSISNLNSTDLDGFAGFNEVFPLFNWYVLETDSNRYKNTGTHVVNDAGGPADNSPACGIAGYPACGSSTLLANMARTKEDFPLPTELRVPGARYCGNADCPTGDNAGGSTGRVDPPWVTSYGWQSFAGQNQYLEFGKAPFQAGENGGIRGHVVYASTRPFDDPALLLQLTWEPMVPHVTINLYKEGFASDGVTPTLTMVDTTETSSWDDWAQGFYPGTNKPYMNCPGQSDADPFFFSLLNQPSYLDWYNSQHGGSAPTALPNKAQYKCYDGMHNWNQLQPAPYDGMYQFPSIIGRNPTTGVPDGSGSTNGTVGTRPGSNCTVCVANPVDGTPMLPAGKYVVEMIVPPGYELVKEEDKNILLGDTYEAPVTTQFAGFGNIFIMPDQASVAASYNANNPLNPTTDLGVTPRHEGDTGSVETFWPCVGTARVVPDYNSLFPQAQQNAPFAGATRNLCDRKEVTLEDQMSVLAKFYVFTSTHVAGHFTGTITDDFTSEFDPFSPHFGEKFSPANLPVSVKDWAGNEISRVYSDHYGIYNGLNYSTFSVNPPDPSGYIPTMMVMCMNDRGTGITPDPLYQATYSQFCYELPFMPGQTGYFDTPVIPTAAFAPEFNHPDCSYPDATPAVSEVDGDGVGPWISAPGSTHAITIHALGDQVVNNYGYSGPSATTAPWNQKTITRHYGFGASQGTGSVKIGGITAIVSSWTDSTIVVTLPNDTTQQVPLCSVQQQQQFGGPTGTGNGARCGELVITADNGKKSVDTVTVTVGGKAPTLLVAGQTIQSAIDAAAPGDLIMVPSGTYHELLVMWKPVRLQGVGAASTIIDANAHPAGILNDWRLRVVCLFGLAPSGVPDGYNAACGTGWHFFTPTTSNPQVDRLPLEATVGWDATLNGNLAEQLQEPTLLGAYEGAGITVVSKGVRFPNGSNPFGTDTFPDNTTLLQNRPQDCGSGSGTGNNRNPFPSNFQCNPSRIDGLSVINSSQGGGGIFVHGWAHNLEISNNRVNNNQGTLAGGISVGQGEHPDGYVAGSGTIPAPGSCVAEGSVPTNTQLPYCFDRFVNVHHNAVTQNSSEGDELFSATPSGAGGVAFCTGADNYQFNYNWVCGNLSTGDGAGVSHLGFVWDASIQHNTILFNQATNPTTPSNGGGLLIMSAPDTDPTCPGEPDADCSHAYGTVGDGIGRNLVVNANLIMGNAAEAGSGGGIRFQGVNGSEVSSFPTNPARWYSVSVTNNIITNNVAGWDGGGVSLQDSLTVDLINNTIVSNDSTASSGALFGAFFAPEAGSPTPCPTDAQGASIRCVPLSDPQPAGISSARHTAEFIASLTSPILCPVGHGVGGSAPNGRTNGACRTVSFPVLYNDVLWQNRAFNIVVVEPVSGSGAQQSTVTLVPELNQATTGACAAPPSGTTYWDIGLRGDHGVNNHASGFTFTPQSSVLTDITSYPGGGSGFKANTSSFSPGVVREYCNGSKIPPEAGAGSWYQVPPGTFEGNVPVPVFNLTAGATVDEGNNWINISWGPLSLIKPSDGTMLGDYSLAAGSTAINYINASNSSTTYSAAPLEDFFGSLRKTNGAVDIGAVEFASNVNAPTLSGAAPNSGVRGTVVPVTITGTNLTGTSAVTVSGTNVNVTIGTVTDTSISATFTILSGAATGLRNVSVTTPGGTTTLNNAFRVTGATVTTTATGLTTNPSNRNPKDGTVTVTNTATGANAGPLTLTAAPTVTRATGLGTFTVTGGTCVSGLIVSPGGSCTVLVHYAPPATGSVTSTGHVTLQNSGASTNPLQGNNFTAN